MKQPYYATVVCQHETAVNRNFYSLQRQRRGVVERVKPQIHLRLGACAGFQFGIEPPERVIDLPVGALVTREPTTGRRGEVGTGGHNKPL